jgi:hypothetical protein
MNFDVQFILFSGIDCIFSQKKVLIVYLFYI